MRVDAQVGPTGGAVEGFGAGAGCGAQVQAFQALAEQPGDHLGLQAAAEAAAFVGGVHEQGPDIAGLSIAHGKGQNLAAFLVFNHPATAGFFDGGVVMFFADHIAGERVLAHGAAHAVHAGDVGTRGLAQQGWGWVEGVHGGSIVARSEGLFMRRARPTAAYTGRMNSWLWIKYLLTAAVVVAVSEFARRNDKLGGLVAALPLVTVLSLVWLQLEQQPVEKIANHARYTFWYVLPTLPMFLVFPWLLARWGFWPALGCSLVLTVALFAAFAWGMSRWGGVDLL